jgi:hypothetical protein
VERLVQVVLARELGQTESEPRVRHDLGAVVLEACLREACAQRIRVADADPVPAVQLLQGDSLRRVLRMEVEGKPEELGVELAPYLLGRDLAEPAERSDVVRPDDERMLGHC